MLEICSLASGSGGNCLYIGTGEVSVLVDAGCSCSDIEMRLGNAVGVSLDKISAVIISHEHIDHVRALRVLSFKYGIPVVCNLRTARAIVSVFGKPLLRCTFFSTGDVFEIGDLAFRSANTQHDANDPVAFRVSYRGLDCVDVGICTDIGFATSLIIKLLDGCRILFVESNHDVEMVRKSNRPSVYKNRVLSKLGHLSNEECTELLRKVCHPGLDYVFLAHLSSECNTPDKAIHTALIGLQEKNFNGTISALSQDNPSVVMRWK